MPDENPTPIKETDPTLLKKRTEARAAMGGNVQQKETPPITEKKVAPPIILKKTSAPTPPQKEVVAPLKKKRVVLPPIFTLPPKEKEQAPKIVGEIKKEKPREPISFVPVNHQGAGLPRGEVLSEELVNKKKRFIIGGILFALLGGLLIILATVFFRKEPTLPIRPVPLPIVPDATTAITEGATTEETRRLIWEGIEIVTSPAYSLHVLTLYKDTETIPLSGLPLFSSLGFTLPESLSSGVSDVLFGFTHNETRDGFFVLKIKSGNTFYESAVLGMRTWENNISETLGTFMSKKEILENGTWSDNTLANIPVRIKEGQGGSHLIYGFFNKETIIIAKTKDVFETVSRRLRTPLPLGSN